MALTMTRTRTQTALTKLAQLVANVHGEMEFVERLLREYPEHQVALEGRMRELEADCEALYATVRQFDPTIDPVNIGQCDDWLRSYARRGSLKAASSRYVQAVLLNTRKK